jgi:excisionase family DNA binding protein
MRGTDAFVNPEQETFQRGENAQPIPERPARLLLTVAEAATTLRVSKWAIYQLIRSRRLATIQIGRRRLIPLTAIQDLLGRLSDEGIT